MLQGNSRHSVILFVVLASLALSVEAAAPPAGYNTLPTRWILKDKDPGGWAGSAGGLEVAPTTSLPFDTAVTHNGLPSLRINLTQSTGWWLGMIVPRGWATADIADWYANGRVEFAVRGNVG